MYDMNNLYYYKIQVLTIFVPIYLFIYVTNRLQNNCKELNKLWHKVALHFGECLGAIGFFIGLFIN